MVMLMVMGVEDWLRRGRRARGADANPDADADADADAHPDADRTRRRRLALAIDLFIYGGRYLLTEIVLNKQLPRNKSD
ncbi:hypothetical protein PUN28_016576 [Cardiocondyla obscurior]|uniref:Uncharacterized protein n=1 Tax=Cardiocondyla obscurior TaxID=286306 RepID=A0AAW2EQG9_9HYME